ncbi:GNAT family N-acetyltransferase [Bacillus salitolerans]|uniref:GNAT family N-acetyltransferase n=1 Tax=Bacillus salitolerans TaxID=1437434 RepID=A0ABW4LTM7_9BACI
MNLETERILLRPLQAEDSNRIDELAGEYDVAKTTLTIPHPYPKGSAKDFIEKVNEAGDLVIFAIVLKDSNSLIGIINIKITESHKRGELGYWVGKPYWSHGYGTEAAKAMLALGFETIELNKIYAQAFSTNPGSWRIMEKIGLKHEGVLRQHVARFGEYHDLSQYGLLRDEYFATK